MNAQRVRKGRELGGKGGKEGIEKAAGEEG